MMEKHAILYLDDEEQNLIAFQALLRKDYRVFTTTDAHEATEILSRENIAVIFSDQKMPDVSGVEFFENIIHEYPTPVRILLTGHADIEAVIDAINKGQVYRYVSKPWESGDLKICIENAVEKFLRDADLMMKKSSLLQTRSEKAIAQLSNHLFQWATDRWLEDSGSVDMNRMLGRIQVQKQIVFLNKVLSNDFFAEKAEAGSQWTAQELIQGTLNSCDRLMADVKMEIKNSVDSPQHAMIGPAIVGVILLTAQLSLGASESFTAQIELNEYQEKFVGRMVLEVTGSGYGAASRNLEVISQILGNYLSFLRGSVQLDSSSASILRITFEGQN